MHLNSIFTNKNMELYERQGAYFALQLLVLIRVYQ